MQVSEAVGLDAFARQWYFLIRTISGGVSVVMYIFVPVFYHRYVTASDNGKVCVCVCVWQKINKTQDSSARRQQLMREKRLMITMGWLAGATFVFLVCGNLARTFLVSYVQPSLFLSICVCANNDTIYRRPNIRGRMVDHQFHGSCVDDS